MWISGQHFGTENHFVLKSYISMVHLPYMQILWRYLPLVFIREFCWQNTFRQIDGKLEDFFIRVFSLFDVLNLFPGYCTRVTGGGLVGFQSYYALSPSHRSPVLYLSAERMQHCPAKQLSCQAGGGHGSTLALILIDELLLRCLYLNSHSLRSARLSLFGKKCSLRGGGFLTIKRRDATAALIKNVLGSSCYTYCIFSDQYKLQPCSNKLWTYDGGPIYIFKTMSILNHEKIFFQ